ncbi:MAG: mechanosensitive ion channel family protein [Patescibacteria group bacterium]|jgi:small-conductance mechanosensitive channel|nr:mechanosensitive ion channel family protein [Patescibacteria group bacterium]
MDFITKLEGIEILGNSLYSYTSAAIVFLAVLFGLKIFKTVVVARILKIAKKTKSNLDDMIIEAIDVIHWPFYVLVSINIALKTLSVGDFITKIIYYLFLISVMYYVIKFSEKLIDYGTGVIIEKKKEGGGGTGIINFLSTLSKVSLWVIAVVLLLSNLGYNVTSLIAGLGIGGIAIALALQNILSDIFSSVSIYFDKPFKIGDFVTINGYSGTIKKIGIKSTRIQALQGEEVIMSNNELTQAQIQNYGIMDRRRVVLELGVTYQTKSEQLRKIPNMLKKIIDKADNATFDRSNFSSYGDSSLGFETVFYIESSDYTEYMKIQEEVNLGIYEEFEKEKIEFAYPTQTLFIEKE